MAEQRVRLELTPKEASVLAFAAGSIGDDLDHTGLDAAEKRAYDRAMQKLREALR